MDIQKIKISQLVPALYNPRVDLKPGDPRYEKIRTSLEGHGLVCPLVWNKQTGHLVSGHQRLKILIEMGYAEVDVSVVDASLAQEKMLNLALNNEYGEWDDNRLARVVEELTKMPELNIAFTGFTLPEISEILDVGRDTKEVDFDIEAAVASINKPITQRGEVIELGVHRVMCGDSSNPNDLQTLMGSEQAGLLDTDFPYNVSYMQKNNRPSTDTRPKKSRRWPAIYADSLPQAQYEEWMRRVMTNVKAFLRPGASYVIWQGHRQIPPLYQILLDLDFHVSCLICWLKESAAISYADFSFRSEHALYGWRLGAKHYWAGRPGESNVWEVKRDPTKNYQHPTQKPVELGRKAITLSSKRGDIVLDTFLGGGGLLLACELLGRRCYAVELDGRYVDVAVRRYAQFVGWDKVSSDIRARYMEGTTHVG